MDYQKFSAEIGENIRAFRKMRRLTQKELAERLHKSLACVSKYEKGSILIDVCTLYEIARALDVSAQLLLPREDPREDAPAAGRKKLPGFFRHSPVYLYCLRTRRREVITSAIDIREDTMEAVLYFDLREPENLKSCSYLMYGSAACSEANIRLYCTNPLLDSDFFLIGCHTPDLLWGETVGFGAALNTDFRFCASKIYLSTTPVRDPNSLLPLLRMNPENISQLKKGDFLSL